MYKNENLEDEILRCKIKRKEFIQKINQIDRELVVLENLYNKQKISFYNSKQQCYNCYEECSELELINSIYCYDCRENDSCL